MSQDEKVHYVQGSHHTTINRHATRTAEDSAGFLFPYLDKLPAHFKFIDLGCGPGSITCDLAARYPSASFLGIDSGAGQIAYANKLAKQRAVTNAIFRAGDLLDLDSVDNGGGVAWGDWDVAYCHQVLGHMQDPVAGLAVMRRLVKPDGGIVACREAFRDGLHFWPNPDPMNRLHDVIFESMVRNGATRNCGMKLVKLALDAGWKRDQIISSNGVTSFNEAEKRTAYGGNVIEGLKDKDAPSTKKYIAMGLATEAELEESAAAVQEWLDHPGSWAAHVNGQLVAINGK